MSGIAPSGKRSTAVPPLVNTGKKPQPITGKTVPYPAPFQEVSKGITKAQLDSLGGRVVKKCDSDSDSLRTKSPCSQGSGNEYGLFSVHYDDKFPNFDKGSPQPPPAKAASKVASLRQAVLQQPSSQVRRGIIPKGK